MMNIEQACAAFKILLEEQQARIANADETKKDFSTISFFLAPLAISRTFLACMIDIIPIVIAVVGTSSFFSKKRAFASIVDSSKTTS